MPNTDLEMKIKTDSAQATQNIVQYAVVIENIDAKVNKLAKSFEKLARASTKSQKTDLFTDDRQRMLATLHEKLNVIYEKRSTAIDKMTARTKAFDDATISAASSTRNVVAAGVAFSAITAAVGIAAQAIREYELQIDALSQKLNVLQDNSRALQQVSMDPAVLRKAAIHGAKYGLSQEESRDVYEPMIALKGDTPTATNMADYAFKLKRLGAGAEDSGQAIQKAGEMGVSPANASAIIAYAAQESPLSSAEMIGLVPHVLAYSDFNMGMMAGTVLSNVAPKDQLQQYTRSAALGLRSAKNQKLKDLAKKYGFQNTSQMNEIQILSAIQNEIGFKNATNPAQLSNLMDINDEREARAIAALELNLPKFNQLYRAQKPLGLEETYYQNMLKDPTFKASDTTKKLSASMEADRTLGYRGAFAQRENLKNTIQGQMIRDLNLPVMLENMLINQETGTPRYLVRRVLPFPEELTRKANASGNFKGTKYEDPLNTYFNLPQPDSLEDASSRLNIERQIVTELSLLRGTVAENTNVTKQNTNASYVYQRPDRGQAWIE